MQELEIAVDAIKDMIRTEFKHINSKMDEFSQRLNSHESQTNLKSEQLEQRIERKIDKLDEKTTEVSSRVYELEHAHDRRAGDFLSSASKTFWRVVVTSLTSGFLVAVYALVRMSMN